jgi:hypothetical protein
MFGATMLAGPAVAQESAPNGGVHPDRLKLEAQARAADSAGRHDEATRLRFRLSDGDFKVGDRVIVVYEGLRNQGNDTLVVQSGRTLRLGEPMGELSLNGLLRFELPDSVAHRVNKYFRGATVHVTPLLRVSLSGAVRSPGYYYSRADTPLSDLISRTAGQDQTTDLTGVTVKRGDQLIWDSPEILIAFREGLTLEGLGLVSGDEVVVGAHKNPWPTVLQFGLPVVSAVVISLLLRR